MDVNVHGEIDSIGLGDVGIRIGAIMRLGGTRTVLK